MNPTPCLCSRTYSARGDATQGTPTAEYSSGLSHDLASLNRVSCSGAIPMPICEEVGAVLFDAKPVRLALEALLARDPRPEEEAGVLA